MAHSAQHSVSARVFRTKGTSPHCCHQIIFIPPLWPPSVVVPWPKPAAGWAHRRYTRYSQKRSTATTEDRRRRRRRRCVRPSKLPRLCCRAHIHCCCCCCCPLLACPFLSFLHRRTENAFSALLWNFQSALVRVDHAWKIINQIKQKVFLDFCPYQTPCSKKYISELNKLLAFVLSFVSYTHYFRYFQNPIQISNQKWSH